MSRLLCPFFSLPTLTPGQRDTLKLIAFAAMVADHANTLFGLHNAGLMLVGRVAFPLFALVWGMNQARDTAIRQASLNRLWRWALLAQPAYGVMVMQAGSAWY